MLFDKSGKGKKTRELKKELKELKKELLSAGCDKTQTGNMLKELHEAILLGSTLQADYMEARGHLKAARGVIVMLLDDMGERPAEEVRADLDALLEDLERVYHECLLRTDDMDFKSTKDNLKKMVGQYTENVSLAKTEAGNTFALIMLRSELENVKAVLDDAAGWREPDFMSLAYFVQHEERGILKEMENEQRNAYVHAYTEENFMRMFLEFCRKAGLEEAVRHLIQEYVYGINNITKSYE